MKELNYNTLPTDGLIFKSYPTFKPKVNTECIVLTEFDKYIRAINIAYFDGYKWKCSKDSPHIFLSNEIIAWADLGNMQERLEREFCNDESK